MKKYYLFIDSWENINNQLEFKNVPTKNNPTDIPTINVSTRIKSVNQALANAQN